MRSHQGEGRLVENLMHFARVLRRCGVPVGPGKVLQAVEAVRAVGLADRTDFYWTLHAVFVSRYAHRELFDQAFHVFWRNPRLLERTLSILLPQRPAEDDETQSQISRRLNDALTPKQGADRPAPQHQPELELDAELTWSARERLKHKDFEQMSADELAAAKRALASLRFSVESLPTRRLRAHHWGKRVDLRATLRASLRSGHDSVALIKARTRTRPPVYVLICDVSGSMASYSRMLLHFAHAVTNDRDRVHTFVFGTRLTNITRHLAHKDVDVALARVSAVVDDWEGGTRIGQCLHAFNRDWSRRLLGQGGVVLLVSDGLDRDAGEGLSAEMERLHKSCRRLVWLNPLLRYDGFEARALGMQAMLPHVDEFRAAHSIASIEELVLALSNRRSSNHTSMR